MISITISNNFCSFIKEVWVIVFENLNTVLDNTTLLNLFEYVCHIITAVDVCYLIIPFSFSKQKSVIFLMFDAMSTYICRARADLSSIPLSLP